MGLEKSISIPNNVFFTEAFFNAVHTNRQVLLDNPNVRVLSVTGHEALKFHGDLFGYLTSVNIPVHLQIATLIVNGYNNQLDFTERTRTVYVPDTTSLQGLIEQINLSS